MDRIADDDEIARDERIRAAERDALVDELIDAERAARSLSDRLAEAVGGPIRVRIAPCPDIDGTLIRAGRDHLWVGDARGFWLIATAEVDGILGMHARRVAVPGSSMPTRWLASAVRELVGKGSEVSVLLGHRWFTSRLRSVGADFVEFEHFVTPLARLRACRVWY